MPLNTKHECGVAVVDEMLVFPGPFVDNVDIVRQPGKSIPHIGCLSRNIGSGTSQSEAGGTVGESLATWIGESRDRQTELACWEPAVAAEVRRRLDG
jgi:hypothetical protein